MPWLTPEMMAAIRAIVEKHHTAFIASVFGFDAVDKAVLEKLKTAGLVDKAATGIDDAYLYGHVAAMLEDPSVPTWPFEKFKEYVTAHPIPLSPVEVSAQKAATLTAANYVMGLGDVISKQTGKLLVDADHALREKLKGAIREEVVQNIAERKTVKQLKTDLGHATQDWTRNLDRVAITEKHNAMQTGVRDEIKKTYGESARVALQPMPDACPQCRRLHLGPDGAPRIFKLSDLAPPGANVGKKAVDWVPVHGALHPHCQCQIVRVPNGWGFDEEGDMVPGGELGVEHDAEMSKGLLLVLESEEEHLEDLTKAYKLDGQLVFQGLNIAIENGQGGLRFWKDHKSGDAGATVVKWPYGYIRGTKGNDGDEVDVYVGPNPNAEFAYVVHQRKKLKDGTFRGYDEDKVMLGFGSAGEAKAAYVEHYNDVGFFGSMDAVAMPDFVQRMQSPAAHTKITGTPVAPPRFHIGLSGDAVLAKSRLIDDLIKGAQHKYLRRIPTGKAKPKYRYIYNVNSKAHGSSPSVGEKIRVSHDGQAGHYTVRGINDDGTVHAVHDETGDSRVFDKHGLHDLFRAEHRDAIDQRHEALKDAVRHSRKKGTKYHRATSKAALASFRETHDIDVAADAEDKLPTTAKGVSGVYSAIMEAAGVKDHDTFPADAKYRTARDNGSVRSLPPYTGPGADAFNERLNRKQPITSLLHGFEAVIKQEKIKTWADLKSLVEMLSDIEGMSSARIPDDVQDRHTQDTMQDRGSLRPEDVGQAADEDGNTQQPEDDFDWDTGTYASEASTPASDPPPATNQPEDIWPDEEFMFSMDANKMHILENQIGALYPDDLQKGAQHKYLSKKKVKGKWVYEYAQARGGKIRPHVTDDDKVAIKLPKADVKELRAFARKHGLPGAVVVGGKYAILPITKVALENLKEEGSKPQAVVAVPTTPTKEEPAVADKAPEPKLASPSEKKEAIHSEAFKAWFGDWENGKGSKVVNEAGQPAEQLGHKPVPMFHGTAVGGFRSFSKDKDKGYNIYGKGFYFTADRSIAEEYTGKDEESSGAATTGITRGGEPVPFLNKKEMGKLREQLASNPNWDANMEWAFYAATEKKGKATVLNVETFIREFWKPSGVALWDEHRDATGHMIWPDVLASWRDKHPGLNIHDPNNLSEDPPLQGGTRMAARLVRAASTKAAPAEPVVPSSEVFEVYLNMRNPIDMDAPIDADKFVTLGMHMAAARHLNQADIHPGYSWRAFREGLKKPKAHRYQTPLTDEEFAAGQKKLKEVVAKMATQPPETTSVYLKTLGGYTSESGDYNPDVALTYDSLLLIKKNAVKATKGSTYNGKPVLGLLHQTPVDTLTWGDVQYLISDAHTSSDGQAQFRDWAQDAGHDGIHHTGGWNIGTKKHSVWIAFEPEQVKATTSENFDPATDDIYKADFHIMEKGDYDRSAVGGATMLAGVSGVNLQVDVPPVYQGQRQHVAGEAFFLKQPEPRDIVVKRNLDIYEMLVGTERVVPLNLDGGVYASAVQLPRGTDYINVVQRAMNQNLDVPRNTTVNPGLGPFQNEGKPRFPEDQAGDVHDKRPDMSKADDGDGWPEPDNLFAQVPETLDSELLKSNFPVGTTRRWQDGKLYRKVTPKKWEEVPEGPKQLGMFHIDVPEKPHAQTDMFADKPASGKPKKKIVRTPVKPPQAAPKKPKAAPKKPKAPKLTHESFTERYAGDEKLSVLRSFGDWLSGVDNPHEGEQNAQGFNKHDFLNWEPGAGDDTAAQMTHILAKYKRQLSAQFGAEEYFKAGLGDPLAAATVTPVLNTKFGHVGFPVDGRVKKSNWGSYLSTNRKYGVKWNPSAKIWYVPANNLAAFDYDSFSSDMQALGIEVGAMPDSVPAPPENAAEPTPAAPPAPVALTAADVVAGIASYDIDDKIAVIRDAGGKFSFYSPYSAAFNDLFSNKSGKLTGITEYNPNGHARETYDLDLVEEAMDKLKNLHPNWEIVTGGVKEAQDERAVLQAELQIPIPAVQAKLAEGYSLFPYQNEGVRFLEKTDGRAIIGDEMGLGKTMQTLAYAAANNKRVLVVVPKVVRRTWLEESEKFFPGHFKGVELVASDLLKLKKKEGADAMPDLSGVNLATINYESLEKFRPAIEAAGFDTIVIDESHRMKNPKAKVTKAIQAIAASMHHRILLSGTAIKNKRTELFTQLQLVDPQLFPTKGDISNSTLGGMWNKMRGAYLARQKATVLKDLPPKTTTITTAQIDNVPDLPDPEEIRQELIEQGYPPSEAEEMAAEMSKISIGDFSKLKGQVAAAKVPATIDMVKEILASSSSGVLVFSDTVAAAKKIQETLGDDVALLHHGQMADDKREAAKKEFQKEGTKKRVFVSTRQSLAVGATLTAADKVVFNDLPWTAADVRQAEDRAHRIGQDNSVNVYWVTVADNRFDEGVANIVKRKYDLSKKVNEGKQITAEERKWMEESVSLDEVLNFANTKIEKSLSGRWSIL